MAYDASHRTAAFLCLQHDQPSASYVSADTLTTVSRRLRLPPRQDNGLQLRHDSNQDLRANLYKRLPWDDLFVGLGPGFG